MVFNGERTLSALCAALFAVHPIHTDAVVSVRTFLSKKPASCCMLKSLDFVFQQIVGRSEVLSGVFYLLSFLAYHRASAASGTNLGFLALSVLSFLLSSFSKEAGVTVLAVNALWDLLNNCRFLDLVTQRPTDADR